MLYVISYDVSEDPRRQQVAEALKDYGRRVQFSVFECDLDEQALAELTGRLDRLVEPETDSCRIYRICAGCAEQVRILGRGDRYREAKWVIV